jgi:hypothetical protein
VRPTGQDEHAADQGQDHPGQLQIDRSDRSPLEVDVGPVIGRGNPRTETSGRLSRSSGNARINTLNRVSASSGSIRVESPRTPGTVVVRRSGFLRSHRRGPRRRVPRPLGEAARAGDAHPAGQAAFSARSNSRRTCPVVLPHLHDGEFYRRAGPPGSDLPHVQWPEYRPLLLERLLVYWHSRRRCVAHKPLAIARVGEEES